LNNEAGIWMSRSALASERRGRTGVTMKRSIALEMVESHLAFWVIVRARTRCPTQESSLGPLFFKVYYLGTKVSHESRWLEAANPKTPRGEVLWPSSWPDARLFFVDDVLRRSACAPCAAASWALLSRCRGSARGLARDGQPWLSPTPRRDSTLARMRVPGAPRSGAVCQPACQPIQGCVLDNPQTPRDLRPLPAQLLNARAVRDLIPKEFLHRPPCGPWASTSTLGLYREETALPRPQAGPRGNACRCGWRALFRQRERA